MSDPPDSSSARDAAVKGGTMAHQDPVTTKCRSVSGDNYYNIANNNNNNNSNSTGGSRKGSDGSINKRKMSGSDSNPGGSGSGSKTKPGAVNGRRRKRTPRGIPLEAPIDFSNPTITESVRTAVQEKLEQLKGKATILVVEQCWSEKCMEFERLSGPKCQPAVTDRGGPAGVPDVTHATSVFSWVTFDQQLHITSSARIEADPTLLQQIADPADPSKRSLIRVVPVLLKVPSRSETYLFAYVFRSLRPLYHWVLEDSRGKKATFLSNLAATQATGIHQMIVCTGGPQHLLRQFLQGKNVLTKDAGQGQHLKMLSKVWTELSLSERASALSFGRDALPVIQRCKSIADELRNSGARSASSELNSETSISLAPSLHFLTADNKDEVVGMTFSSNIANKKDVTRTLRKALGGWSKSLPSVLPLSAWPTLFEPPPTSWQAFERCLGLLLEQRFMKMLLDTRHKLSQSSKPSGATSSAATQPAKVGWTNTGGGASSSTARPTLSEDMCRRDSDPWRLTSSFGASMNLDSGPLPCSADEPVDIDLPRIEQLAKEWQASVWAAEASTDGSTEVPPELWRSRRNENASWRLWFMAKQRRKKCTLPGHPPSPTSSACSATGQNSAATEGPSGFKEATVGTSGAPSWPISPSDTSGTKLCPRCASGGLVGRICSCPPNPWEPQPVHLSSGIPISRHSASGHNSAGTGSTAGAGSGADQHLSEGFLQPQQLAEGSSADISAPGDEPSGHKTAWGRLLRASYTPVQNTGASSSVPAQVHSSLAAKRRQENATWRRWWAAHQRAGVALGSVPDLPSHLLFPPTPTSTFPGTPRGTLNGGGGDEVNFGFGPTTGYEPSSEETPPLVYFPVPAQFAGHVHQFLEALLGEPPMQPLLAPPPFAMPWNSGAMASFPEGGGMPHQQQQQLHQHHPAHQANYSYGNF